jgi:PAS domain-containing protein
MEFIGKKVAEVLPPGIADILMSAIREAHEKGTSVGKQYETTKDGVLILDAETGKIVDANPFLVEMLGYSKEQFIEKAIWEIGAGCGGQQG